MQAVVSYPWPGNVRQLRSLCERWVIVASGGEVTLDTLPQDMHKSKSIDDNSVLTVDDSIPMKAAVDRATAHIERTYLHRLLKRHDGHLGHTATAAGVTRRTLYNKLKAYGLDAADYRPN